MCGMIIQISILQVALVFVWFIGVSSFPTLKDKKDYPKITQKDEKQRELINQMLSKRTNDMSVILRSRRALTVDFPSVPTNTDRGILFSKTNNMLAVFQNGTVKGINDQNSPHVQMERQSFNTSIIRIMAVETGLYVAMKKNGRIVATNKKDSTSLWIENHEMNSYITYRSYHLSDKFNCTSKWFLAIKNNGRMKNGNNTLSGMNSAQFQFLD
ncbi:fibroblast growth factor 2-like isoform X2 [Actinia tenebrosa]|uniref:Fibroblast growth factor 2-like isoform X2 n=1 Tax=Actinia tenebrosa TaxID=6105 RepID=A0A6P8J0M7_ACTTE|nr:fibroblast growth factor 2-like isoform X2 [Actinia tenebrosa]